MATISIIIDVDSADSRIAEITKDKVINVLDAALEMLPVTTMVHSAIVVK